MFLRTFPAELFAEIVENVDTPQDLARLSGVCKHFKFLISPGDELGLLQCCHLSIALDNHAVLRHLANMPMLARSVRKLQLVEVSSRERRVEGYWHEHGGYGGSLNDFSRLVSKYDAGEVNAALRLMFRLESLAIVIHTDIGIPSAVFEGIDECCPFLSCVTIATAPHGFLVSNNIIPLGDVSLDALQTVMAKCTTMTLADGAVPRMLTHLSPILEARCPFLQELCFKGGDFVSLNALHFPRLRSLWLDNITFQPADFADFVDNHPLLEHLHSHDDPNGLRVALHPGALPNIRRLHLLLEKPSMLMILRPLSKGKYRPLEWLSLGYDGVQSDVTRLLGKIRTLTTIQVSSATATDIRNLCNQAKVSTLAYSPRLGPEANKDFRLGKQEMLKHVQVLAKIPSLRCLKSVLHHANYQTVPWSHWDIVKALHAQCPQLLCVDKLVRKGNDDLWGRRKEKRGLRWPFTDADLPENLFSHVPY